MEQRVSFITLAVADLAATRRFYVDGLGWAPELEADDVIMFRVADKVVLSLWAESGFEQEVGPVRRGSGVVPITLAHNLPAAPRRRRRARGRPVGRRRGGVGRRAARVGRLHRLLRRSRRLPLGGRLQPRPYRPHRSLSIHLLGLASQYSGRVGEWADGPTSRGVL